MNRDMKNTVTRSGYSQAKIFPLTVSRVSLMVVAGNIAGDCQNYDFVALNVAVSAQLKWTVERQDKPGQFVVIDRIKGGRRKALHFRFPIPGSYRLTLEVVNASGLTITKITKFIET